MRNRALRAIQENIAPLAILFFAVFVVGLLAFGIALGVTETRSLARCLQKGYPSVRVSWRMEAYCVRRVNQTDEVLRLGRGGQ